MRISVKNFDIVRVRWKCVPERKSDFVAIQMSDLKKKKNLLKPTRTRRGASDG